MTRHNTVFPTFGSTLSLVFAVLLTLEVFPEEIHRSIESMGRTADDEDVIFVRRFVGPDDKGDVLDMGPRIEAYSFEPQMCVPGPP